MAKYNIYDITAQRHWYQHTNSYGSEHKPSHVFQAVLFSFLSQQIIQLSFANIPFRSDVRPHKWSPFSEGILFSGGPTKKLFSEDF